MFYSTEFKFISVSWNIDTLVIDTLNYVYGYVV